MIVVSDTSAINNLAAIGQLVLLKQLHEKVLIPEAVYQELVSPSVSLGGKEAKEYDWIQVCGVSDRASVDRISKVLDMGESEAIALAIEMKADLLLLDERQAREFAEEIGLNITGILGVLLAAKAGKLLSEIRPSILALRYQSDFWLSDALCNRVLSVAGEDAL